jgi:nicotinamidase-related amidase
MTFKRVLIDVDTQYDFLSEDGAFPVSDRDRAVKGVRRIMSWARANRVPIISSIDSHPVNETFKDMPIHCVEGSRGQKKIPCTLMRQRRLVHTDTMLSIPLDLLADVRQVIFCKRNDNFFSNPKADRLLTTLEAEEIIICGVGLERCIRSLTLGLLARHKLVTVVPEACGRWNRVDADLASRLIEAKGARIVTLDELGAGTNGNGHAVRNGHDRRNGNSAAPTLPTDHNGNGHTNGNGVRFGL